MENWNKNIVQYLYFGIVYNLVEFPSFIRMPIYHESLSLLNYGFMNNTIFKNAFWTYQCQMLAQGRGDSAETFNN
jgi:hypothetical protein